MGLDTKHIAIIITIVILIAAAAALAIFFIKKNKTDSEKQSGGDLNNDDNILMNNQVRLYDYELIKGGAPKLPKVDMEKLKPIIEEVVNILITVFFDYNMLQRLGDVMMKEYTTKKGNKMSRALAFDKIVCPQAKVMQKLMKTLHDNTEPSKLIPELMNNFTSVAGGPAKFIIMLTKLSTGLKNINLKQVGSFQSTFVSGSISFLLGTFGSNAANKCDSLAKWFENATDEEIDLIGTIMDYSAKTTAGAAKATKFIAEKTNTTNFSAKAVENMANAADKLGIFNYEVMWKELIPVLLRLFILDDPTNNKTELLIDSVKYISNVCELIFHGKTKVGDKEYECDKSKFGEVVETIVKVNPVFERKSSELKVVLEKLWANGPIDDDDLFEGGHLTF